MSSALQILMRGPYARAMLTNFLFFLALNGFLLLPLYVKRLGGIFSSVCLVGNALGAITFGYVAHGLGYGVMWTGLGLLLALGILTSLRLRPLVPAGEGKQHLQPAHVDRRRHG